MELSDEEIVAIVRLRQRAETEGLTRSQFLRRVTQWVDDRNEKADRREALFDEARRLSEASGRLRPDGVEEDQFAQAQATLRRVGQMLSSAPWRQAVASTWPSVIAHEFERLVDELLGRSYSQGGRQVPAVEASLLQVRDLFEALVKVSAIILMRGLAEEGGDDGAWARKNWFPAAATVGTWVGLLREASNRCKDRTGHLGSIGKGWRGKALDAADSFCELRNDLLGHGLRALDPRDTANAIAGICSDGKYRSTRGVEKNVRTIANVFEALMGAGAFEGCQWFARRGSQEIDQTGAGAASSWLSDDAHKGHDGELLPVQMRSGAATLSLSPFMVARLCSQCGRRDVLIFDNLHDSRKGGVFDLFDFARGHKSRLKASEAPDLSLALGTEVIEAPPIRAGESTKSQSVLEALDKARVDRDYMPPGYLREAFAKFLSSADRGIFWLTAPAHVGKTTFVQGVADSGLDDHAIDPRFGAGRGGRIVAYFCRKEYRGGTAAMINALASRLSIAYDVSDNIAHLRPDTGPLTRGDARPDSGQFVTWLTAWLEFVRREKIVDEAAPLVVAIDGLDEAEAPGRSTPLQLLPSPKGLPAGLYFLLTSRPPGDRDSPEFLRSIVATKYAALPPESRIAVELDTPDYRALLRSYIATRLRLSESKLEDAKLMDDVIGAADKRFAYISFLVDRIENRGVGRVDLQRTAAGHELYVDYLANLDHEYGSKIADGLREVFVALAAAEACRAHVFGAGRIQDLATGAALTPLDEQYDSGVPIAILAALTHYDVEGGVDPYLLLLLETARGALRVSRGDAGATSFTLGLKDFRAAIEGDPACSSHLPRAFARLASLCLDAAEAIAAGEEDARGWIIFRALAPLVSSSVLLSSSELVAARLAEMNLVHVAVTVDYALERLGLTTSRLPLLTMICAWCSPPREADLSSLLPSQRHDLASAYLNRGTAKQIAADHGPGAAIADFDLAIVVMEALRDMLLRQGEEAWTAKYRNDLAVAYTNRGVAKHDAAGHGPGAAIADYDLAIAAREALRDVLLRQGEEAWTAEYRNSLAQACMNRGVAKWRAAGHGPGAAIADYDRAIVVREALRDVLLRQGEEAWTAEYRNDLASAFMNRANAKQDAAGHGPGAAIADYDLVIVVREALRDVLLLQGAEAWTAQYRNDLASALINRGNAKQNAAGHGPGAAIADYDRAIVVMEALRDVLLRQGEEAWTAEYRISLAMAYANRSNAKRRAAGYGPSAVIADCDLAIAMMEALRDVLLRQGEEMWTAEYRNALATAYMNRGNAKQGAAGHGAGAAITDYDLAIVVREALRDVLLQQGEAAWTAHYRNDLASAYMNRGTAKQSAAGHGPGAAIADYDLAIVVMEAQRDVLLRQGEEAWIPEYRIDLARAYSNRGIAKESAADHGPGAAIADYDLAIVVMEALRDVLLLQGAEAWTAEYRNVLAGAYMNRGRAKQDAAGHGPGAAIADYDLAIAAREALRDVLLRQGEEAWIPEYRKTLAMTYMNRGTANAASHGPGAAIADFDLTIVVMEALRDMLLRQGEEAWMAEYRHFLALAYLNRGLALTKIGLGKDEVCRTLIAALEVWSALVEQQPNYAEQVAPARRFALDLASKHGCIG